MRTLIKNIKELVQVERQPKLRALGKVKTNGTQQELW